MAISGGSKKAAVLHGDRHMLREGLEHLSQVLHLVVVDVDFWHGWMGKPGKTWENLGKPGKTWENLGTHLQISVENLGNHKFSELRHPMTPGSMDFGYSATLQTIQGDHPHDKANFKSTSGG